MDPEPGTRNGEPRTADIRGLHAILDVDAAARVGWNVADLARAFFNGGARIVQLRAKHLGSAAFLDHADRLVRAAEPFGATVIVNDRVDIALLSRALGVHVGQTDLPPVTARRLMGKAAIIGYSTHTAEQVRAALREPITYVAVGPVFQTQTKTTGYEAIGLELVSEASRLARDIPVIAIGGITLETAGRIIDAGASGVAVISDLLVRDPAQRIADYLRILSL